MGERKLEKLPMRRYGFNAASRTQMSPFGTRMARKEHKKTSKVRPFREFHEQKTDLKVKRSL
jgi:hypothetical protein